MPDKAFASCLGFGIMCAVVDGQVQGVHARTTIVISIWISIDAGLRVSCAVPDKALAHSLCLDIMCAVVDCQVQGIYAGASVSISVRVGVGA